jgi:hypothetical protein
MKAGMTHAHSAQAIPAQLGKQEANRASGSYDNYKDSFADDLVSGSKSSVMRRSGMVGLTADRDNLANTESRLRTEYDDDFEHITERSEVSSFNY